MSTKLSRYCEGLIEAAWLAAVILIPLFFNIYSSRIFEPDKIAILRSLGLIILGAWLVKLVETSGVHWDQLDPGESKWRTFLRIPMVLPALSLAGLYIVATIFSITPRVSLWGSYQRLQGTYTTLSYLVIFAAILGNLRKRAQVERLITTVILSSLPVVLYGVLQRYKIDPVPWGGDTSIRIAANMGNSIFVAAYLIMVFPLTVGRMVDTFRAILRDETQLWVNVARGTGYVFIAALQVIAIYMSGSRGPALGWMAGTFFLFVLMSMLWRKRWLTLTILSSALALGAFLLVFNIENGPLERLRESPAIGRFGNLLNAESNSALVRKYIWQGAAELVTPHKPLEYPDGRKDLFNFIRPFIGYGPESMYVAFNPFYVPELALVEKRNASPDRSHNETWDSMVITGVAGIIIYLFTYTLLFYYGLRWIGLIRSRRQRNLYLFSVLSVGVIGALGFSLWRGAEYFGVGLPFGMLLGLLAYIAVAAVAGFYKPPESYGEMLRSLTLIVLIAALVAHFVEINFGIAIAVTRTYFWIYTALIVMVGYILPRYGEYEIAEPDAQPAITSRENQRRKSGTGRKKRRGRSGELSQTGWIQNVGDYLVPTLLLSLVLIALGYDFVSNPQALNSTMGLISSALTRLPGRDGGTVSYGVFAMILTTWVTSGVLALSEQASQRGQNFPWWSAFIRMMAISALIGGIYWLWHAGSLAAIARNQASDIQGVMDQVGRYEALLTNFYLMVFCVILVLGYFLVEDLPGWAKSFSTTGAITVGAAVLIVVLLAAFTNVRVIQADIAFKLAEPFTRSGQWPVAIEVYNRANNLAPNEDYYYLFLGRAYLEHSKSLEQPAERDALISQAEADLRKAQALNPLNTDHTANLARLYSLWASYVDDPQDRLRKAETSDKYFSRAVVLSPKNARLWDEWALLYLNILQDDEAAYERLLQAKEIDSKYHWTYALLAEYHSRQARNTTNTEVANEQLRQAVEQYEIALDLPTPGEPQAKYSYAIALGGVEAQLGNYEQAIDAYQQAVELSPSETDLWRIEEAIAGLYIQKGDYQQALLHAQQSLQLAPDTQKERLESLIAQLTQTGN